MDVVNDEYSHCEYECEVILGIRHDKLQNLKILKTNKPMHLIPACILSIDTIEIISIISNIVTNINIIPPNCRILCLENNKLTYFDQSVAKKSMLDKIFFSHNNIHKLNVDELLLEELHVSNNKMTNLKYCQSLRYLDCSHNREIAIRHPQNSNLESLNANFTNNSITQALPLNLTNLFLVDCNIENEHILLFPTSLKQLILTKNNITNFNNMLRFDNLTILHISSNPLNAIISFPRKLNQLKCSSCNLSSIHITIDNLNTIRIVAYDNPISIVTTANESFHNVFLDLDSHLNVTYNSILVPNEYFRNE